MLSKGLICTVSDVAGPTKMKGGSPPKSATASVPLYLLLSWYHVKQSLPFLRILVVYFLSSPEDMLVGFREKGREGGRETPIGGLSHVPVWTELVTQLCVVTRGPTHRRLVYGTTLQATEPRRPGRFRLFLKWMECPLFAPSHWVTTLSYIHVIQMSDV